MDEIDPERIEKELIKGFGSTKEGWRTAKGILESESEKDEKDPFVW